MNVLADLRVLDLSIDIAGPYATKLLADAGADVVKVEPRGGDPLRRWTADGYLPEGSGLESAGMGDVGPDSGGTRARGAGGAGVLFDFLNGGKRSVVGDHAELLRRADIVVCDGAPGWARPDRQVVVSLSPWGTDGPWAARPATEFTLQAWCGSIANRGLPEEPPVYAAGRLGEWVAGSYAALAALAAGRGAQRGGRGCHLDVSILECMAVTLNTYATLFASFTGWPPPPTGPVRSVDLPGVEPTADGWVGFYTVTAQQFQDFLVLIERPDLLEDRDLAGAAGRFRRVHEMLDITRTWTRARTTADIIEQASLLRVPAVLVGSGATVWGFDHFVERGVFVPSPDARSPAHLQPRPPYRAHGLASGPPSPAPAMGADTGTVDWSAPTPGAAASGVGPGANDVSAGASGEHPSTSGEAVADLDRPLSGLRIVDLTAFWAGPAATQALAALGADVIKVESVQRPDGMRFTSVAPPTRDRWWEWGPVFHGANATKRSVTLDLTRPAGVELVSGLIARCDAVVENFSPRVMESFGLGWDAVHAINDRVVMVRMPAYGLDGPWRDRTGFAQNMEEVSGLGWITGWPEGPPYLPRGACDPLAGMHAAFALLVALHERDRTGLGYLVEATTVEAALNAAAEQVLEYTAHGRLLGRDGNRGPVSAPQGVYRCTGVERWLALAVATDDQWRALGALPGLPPRLAALAQRPDLGDHAGRRAAAGELDDALAEWCGGSDVDDLVDRLLAAGVAAAPVVVPRDIAANPQLRARGFFEPVEHPVVGRYDVPGMPFAVTGLPRRWMRSAPPTLGEHNAAVLCDVLGLSVDALAALAAAHVIGTAPMGR